MIKSWHFKYHRCSNLPGRHTDCWDYSKFVKIPRFHTLHFILASNLNFQHLSYFFASRLVLIFACGFDCSVLVLILLKKNLHELPIQSRWLGRLQRKIKLIWFWGIWMEVCPATYFCCHILGQSKPNKVKWKQRDWSRIKMRNIGEIM